MKRVLSIVISTVLAVSSFSALGAITEKTVFAADAVTVNYRYSGVTVKTEQTDATLSSGTYTYYVSAYVEGTDGKLYATGSGPYNRTSTTANVVEEVSLVTDGVFQYKDFNNASPYAYPQYTSGGKISLCGTGPYDILTVNDDGIYSVTIAVSAGGRGIGNGSKSGSVLLNSTNIKYFSYSNTAGSIGEITGLRLSENDVISLTGPNSRAAVDYILIKKTGGVEYPSPTYGSKYTRNMEKLGRGTVAIDTGSGVYLSWRMLGTESLTNQAFDIYRDGERIHTTSSHGATNYTDTSGSASNEYVIVPRGGSISAETAVRPITQYINYTSSNTNYLNNKCAYFDVMIDRPDATYPDTYSGSASVGMTEGTYTANDASVGDVDGDGGYELILKWDPSNSQDNSISGFTSNVYIDAYRMNGTENSSGNNRLWRIDLGKNIRAGAHYTQFIVYDLDGDGRAEIAMRTAPGSKDGDGNYVTEVGDTEQIRTADNEADYRNRGGYVLSGPEYLTIFDGETGVAICTTDFSLTRGDFRDWGDDYGNRVDRFLAGVAYLDGEHPSLIMTRGYYALSKAAAYDFDGTRIKQIWQNVSSSSNYYTVTDLKGNTVAYSGASLYSQGNHSLSVCDADGDEYDEIVFGSAIIDHDGKILNSTMHGHGDAHHVSDFDNDGYQEVFQVHEDKGGYETELRKAISAEIIAYQTSNSDNGRGVMGNILDSAEYPAVFWSSAFGGTYAYNSGSGENPITVFSERPAGSDGFINSLVYWDGDLARELIDGTRMCKVSINGGRVCQRFMFSGSTEQRQISVLQPIYSAIGAKR